MVGVGATSVHAWAQALCVARTDELLLDVRVVDDDRLDADAGTLGRGSVGLPTPLAPTALAHSGHLEAKASEDCTHSLSVRLYDSFGHPAGSVQVCHLAL